MQLIVNVNGEFLDIENARLSVKDRGFMYGDGLFETLRARRNSVFRLQAHMERLLKAAEELDIPLPISIQEIEKRIHQTLDKNELEDAIVRVQLTRGEDEPGLLPSPFTSATLVVVVRPYQPPPENFYSKGVSICTIPNSAAITSLSNHRIKTTNYLVNILLKKKAEERKCYEAIALTPQGFLTEGTVTNIFLVQNKAIHTPTLGPFVMDGITRRLIRETSRNEGISFNDRDLSHDEGFKANEIFLTNTGIGVLPVTSFDGQTVGDGSPGPVTCRIRESYLKIFDTEMGSC
ncbi:MAG: hypothetical protein G3M70_16085 [Candidatus Nitronauta litoralis]|uniref:branched-chain-amino-acid transaminase n=1 Tax=Candidatus Nitronauta litoralis TaxID=2705533 RepID=A0A7T0BYP1_9BACT|nr:MAG: hypothetical protein G3M70_16085 [Candidatus Nitronauta litoralis]